MKKYLIFFLALTPVFIFLALFSVENASAATCSEVCLQSGYDFGACSTFTRDWEYINDAKKCNYQRCDIEGREGLVCPTTRTASDCGGPKGDCWCAKYSASCSLLAYCSANGCNPGCSSGQYNPHVVCDENSKCGALALGCGKNCSSDNECEVVSGSFALSPGIKSANVGEKVFYSVTERSTKNDVTMDFNFSVNPSSVAMPTSGIAGEVRCSSPGSAKVTAINSSGNKIEADLTCIAPSSSGDTGQTVGQSGIIENPLKYKSIEGLVNAITEFIYNLGLVIAPIMFVIAGIMFATSAGDPGRVKTAKDIAIWTAVGFAVILVASGLVKVLQSLLGGSQP